MEQQGAIQMIALALIVGVVMLVVVVVTVGPIGELPEMTWVAAAVAVALGGVVPFFSPGRLLGIQLSRSATSGEESDPDARALAAYRTSILLRYALLEAAALLNAVAYMLSGLPLALGVTALAVLAMLSLYPTRARIDTWVQSARSISR